MQSVIQAEYEALTGNIADPLVIHRRCTPPTNDTLVVLIHGLRGSRYGYWDQLASLLYGDRPDVDLGMYDYRTAGRRLIGPSIELEDEAGVLADALASLPHYRRIVLVGHSMGGLLAKAAVARLVENEGGPTLRRIFGLLLIASPQLGSMRVPRLLQWVSPDARALFPHSRYLHRVAVVWQNRIQPSAKKNPARTLCIPTWAIVAAEDYWVDQMSAGILVPQEQRITVRGSHSSIIRPKHNGDDAYRFVLRCISYACKRDGQSGQRHELVCTEADVNDVEAIRDMAVENFGAQVTPIDTIRELVHWNHGMVSVVRRIRYSAGARYSELLGYYFVMPLNDLGAEAILDGIPGYDLTPDHMPADLSGMRCVYIGAVAGRQMSAQGVAVQALRAQVWSLIDDEQLRVYTRPVTEPGMRLALQHGFKPVRGGGLGNLYQQVLQRNRPLRTRL